MAVYVNNVDYYQPDKSKVLSPEKIALAAKCAGIEPKIVFKNLYVQIVYNQKHQLSVANQVADFIESGKQDIRLLVVSNLTKFFKETKRKDYAAGILKETLGIYKATLVKHQYSKTPKSVIINVRKAGRMLVVDGS
jgi:hypothetical protein